MTWSRILEVLISRRNLQGFELSVFLHDEATIVQHKRGAFWELVYLGSQAKARRSGEVSEDMMPF